MPAAVLARRPGVCHKIRMDITDLFVSELDRETARSRRILENLPEGQGDWKPHDKSMPFKYLANMVATIPMWITTMLKENELDIAPVGGSDRQWPSPTTRGAAPRFPV